MAIEKINIEKFLELANQHPVIDVRSPGEYDHAHIPGAINLPLFTDEERKIVGTIYKQNSREEAIKIGLDFFAPKMRKMVEAVEEIRNLESGIGKEKETKFPIPNSKTLIIYCWRGGMRSAGVAWLMDLYGFKVYTLIGGYKKFRNHVLDTFRLPFQFKILGGYTGSGKTEMLKALKDQGNFIVDLEGLANHKGSAFGKLGMEKQPSQEMFENLLGLKLIEIRNKRSEIRNNQTSDFRLSIWLEDESQRIGDVNIPFMLWRRMRQSPVYFLEIPFEERLKHIVEEYSKHDRQQLIDCINRIKERLGGLETKNAITFLEEDNFIESFRILLKYYDKWYFKSLHNREDVNSLLNIISYEKIDPQNPGPLISYVQKKALSA